MDDPATRTGSIPTNIVADGALAETEQKSRFNYRVWKKNTPYLYDTVVTSALPWPSLTVQWFPDAENCGDGYSKYRLLLGTQTSAQGDEFLRIAHIRLPHRKQLMDLKKYDPDLGEAGGYQAAGGKLEIYQKILHNDEVNRARYMPQNPDILATFSSNGEAYIFDRTKHPLLPGEVFKPEAILSYHTEEGYGLAWSPHQEGLLLTGAADKHIALWDVQKFDVDHRKMSPISVIKDGHDMTINEVEFAPLNNFLFGSVSDAGKLIFHDLRSSKEQVSVTLGSQSALNTLSFNKANEHLVATGGADCTVSLWDIRKLPEKLHTLTGHSDAVVSLEWSPHFPTILASGSTDNRSLLWDISHIGAAKQDNSKPPELLFVHGGHTNGITDVSWNPNIPWMLASAAEDNTLDIWRPADTIVS